MVRRVVAVTVGLVVIGALRLDMAGASPERGRGSRAEAGAFPIEGGYTYNGEVECRVEEVEAFQGQDLYLCKLGFKGLDVPGGQYIYAAIVNGKLHTHQTDPAEIRGRVFDPAF